MTWGRELIYCGRVWCVVGGQGASIIYHGLIHKYLEKHEEDIDGHIVKITHHAKKAAWEVSATVVKVGWRLLSIGWGHHWPTFMDILCLLLTLPPPRLSCSRGAGDVGGGGAGGLAAGE